MRAATARATTTILLAMLMLISAAMAPQSIQQASPIQDLGPEPAAAHDSGGNATGGGQWHWWNSDGCTKVPNWIPGIYNFTHACQHHDGCYAERFSSSKWTCDRWFLNDMLAGCSWWNWQCRNYAFIYYAGVTACGWYSWNHRSIRTPLTRLCW